MVLTSLQDMMNDSVGDSNVNSPHPIIRFKLGSLELGEKPESSPNAKNPNPLKVQWRKSHRITRHEIPGWKDRTQRTSGVTLWEVDVEFRTLDQDHTDKAFKLLNDPGPYEIVAAHRQCTYVYIEDGQAEQTAGEDDDTWSFSMKLVECRD